MLINTLVFLLFSCLCLRCDVIAQIMCVCVCVSAGHPSVTMAPNRDSDSALLPVLQKEDPPTQLSLLSQSIMDQQVCVFIFQIINAFLVCDSHDIKACVFWLPVLFLLTGHIIAQLFFPHQTSVHSYCS